MTWLIVAGLVIAICFAGVLLFGAPYLPTLGPQAQTALELADLQTGDTMIELGCGDGKILLAAARAGYRAVGYELNPILAMVAWLRTRRYRRQIKVVWGNFWRADWPPAAAIFTFLLPRYMARLDEKCVRYPHKPVRLVSVAFEIPGKKPAERKNGVYLYTYR